MRWLKFVLPLIVFAAIGLFLYRGLDRDPRELPSPLIGKPAPAFSLPLLRDPQTNWSPQAMHGRVWLLNVWGSWCTACHVEHPVLLELARSKAVPIVGLAWKDMLDNSTAWLARLGDPYELTVSDFTGKVAIDYGVYGAPETFLIDRQGVIRYKHVGPLTPELLERTLLPKVRELQAAS
ncbi:MAG: DsbE family thiol:disulfide interchange protein [Burkholderiaceae bacterium]